MTNAIAFDLTRVSVNTQTSPEAMASNIEPIIMRSKQLREGKLQCRTILQTANGSVPHISHGDLVQTDRLSFTLYFSLAIMMWL